MVCSTVNVKNISYYRMVGNFCGYKFRKTGQHPGFRYLIFMVVEFGTWMLAVQLKAKSMSRIVYRALCSSMGEKRYVNERKWPHLFARVSVISPLFTSSSTHARKLKKEDSVDQGHCQQSAGSETEPNLSGSIYETSWVKNFRTKIMKSSIP